MAGDGALPTLLYSRSQPDPHVKQPRQGPPLARCRHLWPLPAGPGSPARGMVNEQPRVRRVKVTVEAIAEITDQAALEQAVLAGIDAAEFHADEGSTAEEARAQERKQVPGDPVAAVGRIADPFSVVPDLPGIGVYEGASSVAEVDEHGDARPRQPDFAALFPLCRCAKESCNTCSGFQLTPQTAAALWTAGQILADQAYDDVEEKRDKPVPGEDEWTLLGR